MTENCYLVKKVSITDTLRNIPVGKPVLFDCREAGPMASAKSGCKSIKWFGKSKRYIPFQAKTTERLTKSYVQNN